MLAPNAKPVSCFIELEGLYTAELPHIHTAIASALTEAGISYGGHWGQWPLNTPRVARDWWGEEAVDCWRAARADLLPTKTARTVFESPILASAGL